MEDKIVCVTGASGLLASWLIKRLLEAGYRVRGTVRDPGDSRKTSHLWKLPLAKENLELLRADLVEEGAFDSIFQGCQGVFHLAAPVKFTAENPQLEIVDTALIGTLNVLTSCKKAPSVKRVVMTASNAALLLPSEMPSDGVLDEFTWSSPDICRENKFWYHLAKTLSEKAAWDFASSNNLDLVTILPSLVIGYMLPNEPTASAAVVLNLLKGDGSVFEEYFKQNGLVHIDDVASAHIRAFEDENASGRYVCSAFETTNRKLAEFLAKRYPEYKTPTRFEDFEPTYKCHSRRKLENLLGTTQLKTPEEMFDDCVQSFKDKGLL